MNGRDLLLRVWDLEQHERNWSTSPIFNFRERAEERGADLRLIHVAPSKANAGEAIGRACLDIQHNESADFTRATITVGGFRAGIERELVGVMIGQTNRASRDDADMSAQEELADWIAEQAPSISARIKNPEELTNYSKLSCALFGKTFDWPVARSKNGFLNIVQVMELAREKNEILTQSHMVLNIALHDKTGKMYDVTRWYEFINNSGWTISDDLVLIEQGLSSRNKIEVTPESATAWQRRWCFTAQTVFGSVVESLAHEWSVSVQEIIGVSNIHIFNGSEEKIIARNKDGEELRYHVDVLRNPHHFPVIYKEFL